ncbi:hypothetical protein [Aeromonas phage 32]|nr:hypothetical protein [Aeromonas phage 32]
MLQLIRYYPPITTTSRSITMARAIPAETRIAQINAKLNCTFMEWVGEYTGAKTKAKCRCDLGHEWEATATNLTSGGKGCRECSYVQRGESRKVDEADQLKKLEVIAVGRYSFERVGEYVGNKTLYRCTCLIDGHEFTNSLSKLLSRGDGCQVCAGNYRPTACERVAQLNAMEGVTFSRWPNGYKNHASMATCICHECETDWTATFNSIANGGRCPKCATYGFNPGKPGSLYALMSSCGSMVKLGISNKPEQRLKKLARETPFSWVQVAQIDSQDGAQIARFEKELHAMTEQAITDCTFDGYTEWRAYTPAIMETFARMASEAV